MQIIPSDVQAQLAPVFSRRVTARRPGDFDADWIILDHTYPDELARLGVKLVGEGTQVAVRSLARPIGNLTIINQRSQPANLVLDNLDWNGQLHSTIRLQSADCFMIFCLSGFGAISLPNVLLRSRRQALYWGEGSTAVNCLVLELEGDGEFVAVGDDALISSGVTIRNFDMHAIVDLDTGRVLNAPVSTIIERHVWLGQAVTLIACRRVGFGSIVGAHSLGKGVLPARSIVAGLPARVIAQNRSWGRDPRGLSAVEAETLRVLGELGEA